MMRMSPAGIAMLKEFESCRLEVYEDGGGVWTIGWGHTKGVRKGDTCTQEEADIWLEDEVLLVEHAVEMYVRVKLTQGQFDALVDFCYNLGEGALRKSTLLLLLNQGKYAAAAEQFKRWDHDGGKQVAGLTKRRAAEEKLFLGGDGG